MDKDSPRWIWFLVGRIASYALLGGLSAAIVGAVCVALAGALIALCLSSGSSFGGSLEIAMLIGSVLGGGGGAIAGLLIFGLIGFLSPPARRFLPPRPLLIAVFCGQIGGTIGACSCFFAFEVLRYLFTKQPILNGMGGDLIIVMFGTPALMMCGAIAGAIWGFRRERNSSRTDS